MNNKKNIAIIGAGLAGCEAAFQLSNADFNVIIYDSKPKKIFGAYKLPTFAELVCNNSFGTKGNENALGFLLNELKTCGSEMIGIAETCLVEDPRFFAVDKKGFSSRVTDKLKERHVTIINEHIRELPKADYLVIATGPLTDEGLIESITRNYGITGFHFSDASSPIVDIKSIDLDNINIKKVTDDLYISKIPRDIFEKFQIRLVNELKHIARNRVDQDAKFEKSHSIEKIAKLGEKELKELRFKWGDEQMPCLLLRRENALEDGFILVGCMTTLSHRSQEEVFSMLPGLEECRFIKYGRMHRNTFFDSPRYLNEFFQIKGTNTFIIGQLSGVDGYAPAIASGYVAAKRIICGDILQPFSTNTMIGALARYVSNPQIVDFEPMCASFALMER